MRHSLLIIVLALVVLLTTACATANSVDEDYSDEECGVAAMLEEWEASALTPMPSVTEAIARSSPYSSDTFEPLRIGAFVDSLYDSTWYCANTSATLSITGSSTISCSARGLLTPTRRNNLIALVRRAVALLQERLLVRRRAGRLMVPTYPQSRYCAHYAIPDAHRTEGISDYDVAIYVSAKQTASGTRAWAIGCTDASDGDHRRLVGAINIGPHILDNPSASFRTVVHEMLHALGFISDYFNKWNLLTKRTVRGIPGINVLLIGNTTLQGVMEEHFGCPNREFIEIGDGSHWSKRTMDDVMGGLSLFRPITAMTLGVLEATGTYRAVYEKAEMTYWGRGGGCAFLDEPCLTNKVALPNTQFCDEAPTVRRCSPKRDGLAACAATAKQRSEAWYSQYGLWSSDSSMQFCPLYTGAGTWCVNDGDKAHNSIGGSGSFCLDASAYQDADYVGHGVCALVRCGGDGTYSVKFKGDADYRACKPGETVLIGSDSQTVTCPPVMEVCLVTQAQFELSNDPNTISSVPPFLPVTLAWAMCVALIVVWWL